MPEVTVRSVAPISAGFALVVLRVKRTVNPSEEAGWSQHYLQIFLSCPHESAWSLFCAVFCRNARSFQQRRNNNNVLRRHVGLDGGVCVVNLAWSSTCRTHDVIAFAWFIVNVTRGDYRLLVIPKWTRAERKTFLTHTYILRNVSYTFSSQAPASKCVYILMLFMFNSKLFILYIVCVLCNTFWRKIFRVRVKEMTQYLKSLFHEIPEIRLFSFLVLGSKDSRHVRIYGYILKNKRKVNERKGRRLDGPWSYLS